MWQLSMHGSTDHLDPEVAEEVEGDLREKLLAIFAGLVEAGHQGVAGVFHHSHGAPANLADTSGGPWTQKPKPAVPGAPEPKAEAEPAEAPAPAVEAVSETPVDPTGPTIDSSPESASPATTAEPEAAPAEA